jgi:hypothetical protein
LRMRPSPSTVCTVPSNVHTVPSNVCTVDPGRVGARFRGTSRVVSHRACAL